MTDTLDKYKITMGLGTLIIILVFIITQVYFISVWKTDIENNQKILLENQQNHYREYLALKEAVEKLDKRQNSLDILTATIETRLNNIEFLLTEIRTDLKR